MKATRLLCGIGSGLILLLLSLFPFGKPHDISIAVASNFAHAAEEIAAAFEHETGRTVALSPGSTGKHYAQTRNGASFDLFLAADTRRPKLLEDEALAVPGTRFTYAVGRLALWSPLPKAFEDGTTYLKEANFRHIAIANPELAPYGAAAREVLSSLGAPNDQKLVFGENIAQTFHFVHSGAADAGLVALSQIRSRNRNRSGSLWLVPGEMHSPIQQQAVLLKDSQGAREFLKFLGSESAKEIIQRHGYDLP